MIQLVDHFSSDSRSRHSEWLRQQRWFIKAKNDKTRKEEHAEKLDDLTDAASIVVAATEVELQQFEVKLDTYDQATVAALMKNREALDAVNEQLLFMLDQAHIMDDGRRVFKSEDGSYVIDEHGNQVSPDELDFDLISDTKPTAEAYRAQLDAEEELQQERQDILDYQEKLDDARERTSVGDISKQELDELEAELADAMPTSVRKQMPGFDTSDNAPDVNRDFSIAAPKEIAVTPSMTQQQNHTAEFGQ